MTRSPRTGTSLARFFPAALVVPLVAGVILGVLFQKYYGAGRLLAVLGLRAMTGTPPVLLPPEGGTVGLPEHVHGRVSLFILAGQSNMSGRGDLPAGETADPRIFTFGNDYRWRPALEPVDDPSGQVDSVSEDGGGDPAAFGPALSFARALVDQRPDLTIGLIPCAKGNSTIVDWRRHPSDATLYGSCVKRVRAASTAGGVSGLLFLQGEADALTPESNRHRTLSVEDYGARFSAVIDGLRQDLSRPDLPVVFAQIGTNNAPLAFANWDRIREQQRATQLTCGAMIVTDDLPLRDGVHFTTASYRVIGRRFAAAYLGVIADTRCPS
jgi:hypothetical protein